MELDWSLRLLVFAVPRAAPDGGGAEGRGGVFIHLFIHLFNFDEAAMKKASSGKGDKNSGEAVRLCRFLINF